MAVLRTQLRGLAARPSRLLLTAVSVAVATAFAFGTALAAGVVERTVVDNLSGTPAAADLVVEWTGSAPITDREAARAERTPGVAEVAGRITGTVTVGGVADSGTGPVWDVVGDPGSGALSLVEDVRGTYPRGAAEVAVTERTAARTGLHPGSRLTLLAGDQQPRVVTVTAVVRSPTDSGYQLFGTGPAVAALSGDSGGYLRLDVRAEPGTDLDALAAALRSSHTEVLPAAEVRSREAGEASADIAPLLAIVSVFVLVAVLAAVLVTASTFRIVFAQRMSQLALLRTIGAGRPAIVLALLVEGAVTGAVAGLLGIGSSLGIAHATTGALHAAGHAVSGPGFPLGTAAGCLAGAVLVTVAAVLAPAFSASRVRPLEALRTAAVADTAPRRRWVRVTLGVLLLGAAGAAALAALVIDPSGDPMVPLLAVVASGTAAFGALLAFGPFVTPPLARVVGWPVSRLCGVPGRLAVRGAVRVPRRVAATTVVIALGATLVTSVLVGSASLRGYADAQLATQFPSDLRVFTVDGSAVPDPLLRTLHADAGLSHVAEVRQADAVVRGPGGALELTVMGLRTRDVPDFADAAVDDGSLHDVAPGRVAVSRDVARDLALGYGDPVSLAVGGRELPAVVASVYDGSAAIGSVLVDTRDLRGLAPAAPVTSALVDVVDGSAEGMERAHGTAVRAAGQGSPVVVLTPARERAEIDKLLTIVSSVALGLLGLTVLIAVVGVATTMALSVVERTREFGLLRALGLGRRGLRASVTLESGLLGTVGAVLGLALGLLYGWLALQSLGLPAPLVVPVGSLAVTAALLVLLAGAAGLLPSRRAARTAPVEVLAAT
jgi:putative ABC transport system permease protein